MKTVEVNLSDIRENPNNPRLIKDDKFKKLVQSIKEFPQMLAIRPIVVNADMTVLGGNMRLKACKEAGLKKVPILVANDLTEAQQKEFIIKDNVGFGEWDWELIANEWDAEQLTDWGLDIPDFAIETPEAQEDDYEIPDEVQTDIVLGDLFEIGQHRLLCGDSTDSDAVAKLMNGEKADMVFTDPPYGVSYVGVNNPNGRKWDMIKNDQLRGDGLFIFLFEAFCRLFEYTNDNIALYVWHASSTHIQFETALNEAGFEVKQQLIWNKGMVLGHSDYHWAHEPVLYCKKKNKKTEWYGDRTNKTILGMRRTELTTMKKEELVQIIKNLLDTNTCWEIDRDNVIKYQHPTQKPVKLAGKALMNSSKEQFIVLDLFLGSGSTMVAAHQLNRKCYGMEIDPKYCQVIIDRMRKLDPSLVIKRNGVEI